MRDGKAGTRFHPSDAAASLTIGSPGAAPAASSYRPDIDGLRAISIALVLAYHAFPRLCPGGFVGVDVFFVISGFLITGIVLRDIDHARFSLLDFYARRFRRIVPALACVLIAVLAAGLWVLLPAELANLGLQAAAASGFVLNLVLYHQVGYFDTASSLKPLLHLWSLAVEEQYYLVWPLLLVVATRLRLRRGWLFGALFALSFGAMLLATKPFLAFYMLPFRFWELLAGGALAWVQQRPSWPGVPRHLRVAAGSVAMAMLAIAAALLGQGHVWPSAATLLPTGAAMLLIACGPRAWINRHVLGNRAAAGLGLVSYPLYLWHWPLLSFARIIEGSEPPAWVRLLLLLASLGLAWATWRLVERPVAARLFATRNRPGRNRATVAAALTVLGSVAIAGTWLWRGGGEIGRAAQMQADLGQDRFRTQFQTLGMLPMTFCPNAALFCRSQGAAASRLLIGDSHAEQYIPGLVALKRRHGGWMFTTKAGCPATRYLDVWADNVGDVGCARAMESVLSVVRADPALRTVVLASLWERYFGMIRNGSQRFSSARFTGSPQALYAQGLSDLVGGLQQAGKTVVLVRDDPGLTFDINSCVRVSLLPRWLARQHGCAFSKSAYLARVADYTRMISAIVQRHPGVLVYDGIDLFCRRDTCSPLQNGRSLYRDTDHLSLYGGALAARRLARWLDDRGL